MISLWVFFFLAALAIIFALGVIIQTNPVHSLLSLVMTLLTLALLFIQQDAVVVGLLQIIVYAGAIMVLFLFVIWLLNLQAQADRGHLPLKFFGSIAAAALGAELLMFLLHPHLQVKHVELPADYGSLASLAHKLFTDYLVAFEATSILLLAAVVGAIAIARRPSAPVRVEQQIEQGAAR
ncbi:MAG TPA: NADH-quinone oxidoreductase subunit J [Candidatus Binataceae bacterium]|nr:NADH-quinone oxidoreductase subunit J [Candidatus Binataceae bacterium]